MPHHDGTGPLGNGPLGKNRGGCAHPEQSENMGCRHGMGRGKGFHKNCRNGIMNSNITDIKTIEALIAHQETKLETLRSRLSELQKQD